MPRVPVKLVTWEEIVEWSRGLARRIRESGYRPTVIVAVARGGYVPARLLADFLYVTNMLSIQSQHWTEAARAEERAILKFPYKVDLSGHRVLLVDDIVDTGETLLLAKQFILDNWRPEEVRVATLQWISSVAKFKPDYYYLEVRDWTWFQYPWTRLEDTMQFIRRMLEETARETGRTEWTIDEVKKLFKEWYGIEVEDFYYSDAIELLEEQGFLERVDGRVRLRQKPSEEGKG